MRREAEFTEYRPVRVLVGTWNVNGKTVNQDLSAWLTDGGDGSEAGTCLPDVYVVGLQEMVSLTGANVVLQMQCATRAKEWCALLQGTLRDACGGRDTFELVASRYLVGVFIAVLVKKKYLPYLSGVQAGTVAVGLLGVAGNKGAAAVRFRLFDTPFCFVCAHLAASRDAVAARNADFHTVNAKMEFRDEARAEAAAAAAGEGGGGGGGASSFGVFDHDCLVWLGDFNYRIAESVPTDKVFELCAAGTPAALESLRRADQLNMERAAGRAFQGFSEGALRFRPTYKFAVGTSAYDRPDAAGGKAKKVRPPAWCDRVLWRCLPSVTPRHFRQLYYGSVDALTASDHKPVHALFEVAVKSTIEERRRAVLREVAAELAASENASAPVLRLSDAAVHFADVVYGLPAHASVTLENRSDVAAPWRLLAKPEEKVLCKTWLQCDPAFGLLKPRASVKLRLTVTVDDAVARDISLGRELAAVHFVSAAAPPAPAPPASAPLAPEAPGATAAAAAEAERVALAVSARVAGASGLLEDLLILRTERGHDLYLPVSAVVLPSAWGASLAQLSRRPEPMRASPITAAASAAINAAAGAGPGVAEPPRGGATFDPSAGSRLLAQKLGAEGGDADGGGEARRASWDKSRKGNLTMGVPKEIWRLADALVSRPGALGTPGLFTALGAPGEVLAIRAAIDTGDALPAGASPVSIAAALMGLVGALREPLIPSACLPAPKELEREGGVEAWTATTLRALPPLHYNVLVYLVRLSREALFAGGAREDPSRTDDLAFALSRAWMRGARHEEASVHAPHGTRDALAAAAATTLLQGGGAVAGSGAEGSFADQGTRWEPKPEEQNAMCQAVLHLLKRDTKLAVK
jgi:hypothetical protein